jgi:hypothetical protein
VYYSVGSAATNGSNASPILRSTDGLNFYAPTSIPSIGTIDRAMLNIVYGTPNGVGTYVAAGQGAFLGVVWYSTDGLTWQASTTPDTGGIFFANSGANLAGLRNIAYGNGVFVIIGSGNSGSGFYYSTDGITFRYQSTNAFAGSISAGQGIAHDGTKFVAVGVDSSISWRWSTDGSNWSSSGFTGSTTWPNTGGTELVYNGSMWLATGYISGSYCPLKYSYDGFSWTSVPTSGTQPNTSFIYLSWDGLRWYAGISGGGYSYASSYDGFTWTYGTVTNVTGNYLLSVPNGNATVNGNMAISNNLSVSSIISKSIVSISTNTSFLTATQTTVSSLVGNNISSLTAQVGGITVSSLVSNNLSSLLAQTGIFTGIRTTVSSLIGNNISTISLQTSSILTNGIVANTITANTFTVVAFVSSIVSSVFTYLSSSTVQTSSLTSINISSLFGQIGVLAASHTSVSSISASTITTNTITSINPIKLNTSTVIAQQDSLVVEDFINYNTYTTNPIDYTNMASSFTTFSPGFFCQNAFLSGNGQHHVLFGMSSLWRSSNYGSSWTNVLSTNAVSTLQFLGGTASATGKYMTVTSVGNPGYTSNYIYTSKDYGATWISGSVSRTWASNIPAMSASGQYQIACTTNDYPWSSSDYGVTWTAITSISFNLLWCCAISASGQYQAIAWYNGQIYISVNYGVTWSLRTSLSNYLIVSLHMSGNGKYIFASSQNQLPYFSSDYGTTWTSLSSGGVCVAMSYTGQYILINTTYSLSLSQDYGVTFGPTNSRLSGTGPGYLAAMNATAQYIYGFGSESLFGGPRDYYPQRGFLPILAPGGITGNLNMNPYRLLVNGSSSNLAFSDNGRTFLFGLANSQSATLLLPSTTTISPGWTCKIVNMNTSGTGSNANLYVSSSQSLIYGQAPSGRSTFAHINVNGTTTVTNTYTKYVNIVYDGSNYYAIP